MGTKIKKNLFMLLIALATFAFGINYVSAAPGEITVTKSAEKEDEVYGRTAEVTLSVNAASFTTVNSTDVVLVLDRSGSMNGTKMANTKAAANNLIDLL